MNNFGHVEDGKVGSLTDIQLWRRIFTFSLDYWWSLVIAVIFSLLVTGGTLCLPYLLQQGIDFWITAADLALDKRIEGLSNVVLQYGLLVLLVFVLSFLQVLLLEYIGQSIMHLIRQRLFAHLLDLDLQFIQSNSTGRLVTRLTNDIQNMHEMFTSVLITLFNDFLRVVGILVLLFLMNVKLALAMTAFVPVALFITVVFSRLAREKFSAIRAQLALLNSYLAEAVSGMYLIQLFSGQEKSRNKFEELSEEFLRRSLSQVRLFSTFMPMTEFLGTAAIGIILWYGGGQVVKSELTLGELVAFLSYMRLFFQPLRELSQKYSIVQSAMASADRIFNLLDRNPAIKDPANQKNIETVAGDVEFKDVVFSYDKGQPVLHGINLKIAAGKTVALVGTTGSGKSTLINLLLRFYDPDSGMITLDNVDVREISSNRLRHYVGVVLQDVYLLQDSLEANIAMDSGVSREEIEQIMEQTGMQRFVRRLSDGLETMIGEGGHELSTGEKQLLAIARVLCRKPAVLILDEATASIDSESEGILEEALSRGFNGKTSIIIAHRLSTIRRADLIGVMKQGRLVEFGSHESLMEMNGCYRSLMEMDLIVKQEKKSDD